MASPSPVRILREVRTQKHSNRSEGALLSYPLPFPYPIRQQLLSRLPAQERFLWDAGNSVLLRSTPIILGGESFTLAFGPGAGPGWGSVVDLMEADRCAKNLRKSVKLPEEEASLSHGTVDHLDEILQMSYHDAIKGFRTKPNPTLLLMMLYHYDAYVKSAMERWAPTIEALREIDPVINKKAENLAGSGKELEFKSPTK